MEKNILAVNYLLLYAGILLSATLVDVDDIFSSTFYIHFMATSPFNCSTYGSHETRRTPFAVYNGPIPGVEPT